MFSNLLGLSTADKGQTSNSNAAAEELANAPERMRGGHSASTSNSLVGLWGMASSVTQTLATSVKTQASELVKTVQETDWKTEIMAFGMEAAQEGKSLGNKTVGLVEHAHEAERAVGHVNPGAVDAGTETLGAPLAKFGQTLLVGTKELLEQVYVAVETEMAVASRETRRGTRGSRVLAGGPVSTAKLVAPAGKYSRLEAKVAAMQRDSSTYCDEPDDAQVYAKWRSTFSMEAAQAEISKILADNTFMAELQTRIVPIVVDRDEFWTRYFYRLRKLQQKEEQRHSLAQRAKTLSEAEESLGWDDFESPGSTVVEDKTTPLDDVSGSRGSGVPATSAVPSGPGVEQKSPTKDPASSPALPAQEQLRPPSTPGTETVAHVVPAAGASELDNGEAKGDQVGSDVHASSVALDGPALDGSGRSFSGHHVALPELTGSSACLPQYSSEEHAMDGLATGLCVAVTAGACSTLPEPEAATVTASAEGVIAAATASGCDFASTEGEQESCATDGEVGQASDEEADAPAHDGEDDLPLDKEEEEWGNWD